MRNALLIGLVLMAWPCFGAGTLTPVDATQAPIQIRDHHVRVVINNGFALTEVFQTFHNPNGEDLEAIYSFPLPESASLSEVSITAGETEIHGEVLEKARARQVYEDEKSRGRDAGLATKEGYQSFDFRVYPVRAQGETRVRFLYYQPLKIDTGMGRYVYPLEDGGTADAGASFWQSNDKVEGTFSIDLELKSSWPVDDVRMPGFQSLAQVSRDPEELGRYAVSLSTTEARLDRDFVFYYRLADNLPGRVEVIPYREAGEEGTFMLVVTPGIDLQPLSGGSDYVFVLDVSGSMRSKMATLAQGVEKALGSLNAEDRFRVITFSSGARDLTGWQAATSRNVRDAVQVVKGIGVGGSTNMFEGVSMALKGLDDDRVTSVILVTDAVTNTGVVAPQAFYQLLQQCDVRVFGFLLGNGSNWPLMRTICDASGGFFARVSNQDDILGQLMLAKSKITHECLHDAQLTVRGVKTEDVTEGYLGKVYRGQQLVLFGRYRAGGEATVTLKARLTGEDRVYRTRFEFPEVATDHPELERLWALSEIEVLEARENAGLLEAAEARQGIVDLGLQYQLVTDHTSMVVLSDEAFEERGIERRNQKRVQKERAAQSRRASTPPRDQRVDRKKPTFRRPAPRFGGGALDPFSAGLALGLGALALGAARRKRS